LKDNPGKMTAWGWIASGKTFCLTLPCRAVVSQKTTITEIPLPCDLLAINHPSRERGVCSGTEVRVYGGTFWNPDIPSLDGGLWTAHDRKPSILLSFQRGLA